MEKYVIGNKIGAGSFGTAHLATSKKDGMKVVVKVVETATLSDKEKREVYKESVVLKGLHHPSIIQHIDTFEVPGKFCIVAEFAEAGDLETVMKKKYPSGFPENAILDYFIQVAMALTYVHKKKVLHRDLKLANVFLSADNMIKMGDFGISKILKNTLDMAKTAVGTPYYMAPEILNGKTYNAKADVWACGVMLYYMCCGRYPFEGTNMATLTTAILNQPYDTKPLVGRSKEMRAMIKWCLQKNPSERADMLSLVQQNYIFPHFHSYVQRVRAKGQEVPYAEQLYYLKANPGKQADQIPDSLSDPRVPQDKRLNNYDAIVAQVLAGGGGAGGAAAMPPILPPAAPAGGGGVVYKPQPTEADKQMAAILKKQQDQAMQEAATAAVAAAAAQQAAAAAAPGAFGGIGFMRPAANVAAIANAARGQAAQPRRNPSPAPAAAAGGGYAQPIAAAAAAAAAQAQYQQPARVPPAVATPQYPTYVQQQQQQVQQAAAAARAQAQQLQQQQQQQQQDAYGGFQCRKSRYDECNEEQLMAYANQMLPYGAGVPPPLSAHGPEVVQAMPFGLPDGQYRVDKIMYKDKTFRIAGFKENPQDEHHYSHRFNSLLNYLNQMLTKEVVNQVYKKIQADRRSGGTGSLAQTAKNGVGTKYKEWLPLFYQLIYCEEMLAAGHSEEA